MCTHQTLFELFLDHLPGPLQHQAVGSQTSERRFTALLAKLETPLAASPQLQNAFTIHLAGRLPEDGNLDALLEELQGEQLYLAYLCGTGEPEALREFEELYFPAADNALAELKVSPDQAREIKQLLRTRFFTPSKRGNPPAVLSYSGRGSLFGWVRISAIREVYRSSKDQQRWQGLEEEQLTRITDHRDDPELKLLKERYRKEFAAAFGKAMESLEPRQRNILRHYYLDEMTIDQIGALYQVNRVTAFRWLEKTRGTLFKVTRQEMTQQLKVSRGQYESIFRLIESQLEVSICAFVAPTEEE